mgnify:FL=1
MKSPFLAILGLLACTSLVIGQQQSQPYEHAVPPPSVGVYGGGGYGGY